MAKIVEQGTGRTLTQEEIVRRVKDPVAFAMALLEMAERGTDGDTINVVIDPTGNFFCSTLRQRLLFGPCVTAPLLVAAARSAPYAFDLCLGTHPGQQLPILSRCPR